MEYTAISNPRLFRASRLLGKIDDYPKHKTIVTRDDGYHWIKLEAQLIKYHIIYILFGGQLALEDRQMRGLCERGRYKALQALRTKNYSLSDIGKVLDVSGTRIQQMIKNHEHICSVRLRTIEVGATSATTPEEFCTYEL